MLLGHIRLLVWTDDSSTCINSDTLAAAPEPEWDEDMRQCIAMCAHVTSVLHWQCAQHRHIYGLAYRVAADLGAIADQAAELMMMV